jgi:hypothetical protein
MATTPKTSIKPKLLPTQQKLDITNMVMLFKIFLAKNHFGTSHYHVNF